MVLPYVPWLIDHARLKVLVEWWSSLAEWDEGKYQPKWKAVSFMTCQNNN